ncbi:MobQ family relaxase [Alkalihalobacillus sp. TS-13]|uniref:MobQ family relaxase n=1 Tax=Alkalihalobacillus sp. TS-13 TaxID=2842455 RepID=UPI001C87087B|nr:MobQ family relaxase [Alkalihalobacillus sp. TS-13]
MAIYHFSVQILSRSNGQSAVASASYRSGEKLIDDQTGEPKFYKRTVKPETMIIAPPNAPEWVYDRNRLWNAVEQVETRKNSQLAREINIALPVELSNLQQRNLIQTYVQTTFIDIGMIADIAIHRDDEKNPHVHVMLPTREISKAGFTVKNREWNDRRLLKWWRQQWAEHVNRVLEEADFEKRITHLSHEARRLKLLPTIHLGHVAHAMEKKGMVSERGQINRERLAYNELVLALEADQEDKEVKKVKR